MSRQKIFLAIPIIIIAGLLISCWAIILSTDILATWRHYLGLGLFLILIILSIKSFKWTAIGTGFYLLLATINILSMTAEISTNWVSIGPFETPPIQLLSLGLFILFAILNFDTLIDIYVSYKDPKQTKW